jgi:hypothetical protein
MMTNQEYQAGTIRTHLSGILRAYKVLKVFYEVKCKRLKLGGQLRMPQMTLFFFFLLQNEERKDKAADLVSLYSNAVEKYLSSSVNNLKKRAVRAVCEQ